MNSKSFVFIIASLASIGSSAQTLTGTVKDNFGALITASGSPTTVEIHAVPQPAGSQSGHVRLAAGFSATAAVDSTGAFSIANIPAGQYWLCAYASSQGYLSNCDWSAAANRPITVPAATQLPLTLTLAKGAIVTLDVNDPGGKIATVALKNGHWFYPGVMDALGNYSAARPSSTIGTHHYYLVTIPVTTNFKLFIDSDLIILGASSNSVATRKLSAIVISGTNGPVNLLLSVQ
jgi:hypothetical protein